MSDLPRWDMTPVFPSFESEAFEDAYGWMLTRISDLKETFEKRGIRTLDDATVDDEIVYAFEDVVERLNDLYELSGKIRAYIHAFVTTDARDDEAQSRSSRFLMDTIDLDKLEKRFVAWLGSLDVDELIDRSPVAAEHGFFVRRAAEHAKRQMSEMEEDLASSLHPSGQGAWAKLHGNVSSRLIADVRMPDGTTQQVPIGALPGLAEDPDERVRRAAHDAAMATWPKAEVPLAAALNSIKGWQNELDARRGWPDSLEPALFGNNVDRPTLEAMQRACIESFGDFTKYMNAKAKLIGKERLAWWDLSAPVGDSGRTWNWGETRDFIVEHFGTYSEKLARLGARAFDEGWIDAEPREGKRGGGFCMRVQHDESRIFVNFTKTFQAVTTVAHELGHAFHNVNLAGRTPLQRRTPMALAETASTFCETIVGNALLRGAEGDEKLGLLNGDLVRDMLIVVSIHSRFLFEKAVYEARRERELSAAELCRLMSEKQLEVFGDAIDPEGLHPYMWCVSPHYYGYPYYNWPYTFGLLFGLGLYKRFVADPEGFRAGYDDLLSSTGMADAATLCARFDIDVRSVDFWRSSLDVCRSRIDEFVSLAT
jgi:pepF/M3 family oligoendopeptidase